MLNEEAFGNISIGPFAAITFGFVMSKMPSLDWDKTTGVFAKNSSDLMDLLLPQNGSASAT